MRRLLVLLPLGLVLAAVVVLSSVEYGMARPSQRIKNLAYVAATAPDFDTERHRLDVYAPRRKAPGEGCPVVLFMHGGNWNSGNKNIYTFVGRRLARQGVVAVVINYRLAPKVKIDGMADDCARALAWTVQHIGEYGGDPGRVFVMGHSAGGGLAAILTTDDGLLARHGLAPNPVRGAILDDPAGLDMYTYLKSRDTGDTQYHDAFGGDPAGWKAWSPIYRLRAGQPPFLLFIGGETYPSISSSSERFRKRLGALGMPPTYQVLPGKKHVPMVLQLYWQHNVIYKELLKLVGAG
ncbi:alpha/beta hydrolase [Hymenobacter sp. ASUV-10]|uniref:Alpha/beta hydrolase n=1 Tax=Hymenobacter aranciens TaxID=3063996 RepID=A0ABT9BH54_9BACT|nr:alpha/beta hydrolase [Hymenobacter sp. ASUV-10]MDO7877594.1 alpha/beta hydrolase [Hymenobacter sp. ASUV-10]